MCEGLEKQAALRSVVRGLQRRRHSGTHLPGERPSLRTPQPRLSKSHGGSIFCSLLCSPRPATWQNAPDPGSASGPRQLRDVSVMDLTLGVNDYSLVGAQLAVGGVVQTCLWAWRLASASREPEAGACPCLRRKRARSNVSSCAGPSASKRALIFPDCRSERMRWSSSGPIVS